MLKTLREQQAAVLEHDDGVNDDDDYFQVLHLDRVTIHSDYNEEDEEVTICGGSNATDGLKGRDDTTVYRGVELWELFEIWLDNKRTEWSSLWGHVIQNSLTDGYWITTFIPNMLNKILTDHSNSDLSMVGFLDMLVILSCCSTEENWENVIRNLIRMVDLPKYSMFSAVSILVILSRASKINPHISAAVLEIFPADCHDPAIQAHWLNCISIRSKNCRDQQTMETKRYVDNMLSWKSNFGHPEECVIYRNVCSIYSSKRLFHTTKQHIHTNQLEILQNTVNRHTQALYLEMLPVS